MSLIARLSGCDRYSGTARIGARHIGTYSRCELSEGAYAAVHLYEMPTTQPCGKS